LKGTQGCRVSGLSGCSQLLRGVAVGCCGGAVGRWSWRWWAAVAGSCGAGGGGRPRRWWPLRVLAVMMAQQPHNSMTELPALCRTFRDGRGGFRTCDLSRVKPSGGSPTHGWNPRPRWGFGPFGASGARPRFGTIRVGSGQPLAKTQRGPSSSARPLTVPSRHFKDTPAPCRLDQGRQSWRLSADATTRPWP
jgi:hypothetical protein